MNAPALRTLELADAHLHQVIRFGIPFGDIADPITRHNVEEAAALVQSLLAEMRSAA